MEFDSPCMGPVGWVIWCEFAGFNGFMASWSLSGQESAGMYLLLNFAEGNRHVGLWISLVVIVCH